MKSRLLFIREKRHSMMLIMAMLLFNACIDGYKDDWTFSSGVQGVTLESPNEDKCTFVKNADGTSLKITWPVVYGAGGYQVSFYNVDNPQNMIAIGEENEIVDGCSITRNITEDTSYKVVIKALGNDKLNNKDAVNATEISYSTLVPIRETIPSGTNLTTYFTENPIQPLNEGEKEIAYQLEAGGQYTMDGDIALGLTTLTIRGDKNNHAKLTMTGTGKFISDGVGFKLKFMDIDCNSFTGDAIITYNVTQNPSVLSNTWVTIVDPVAIQSCQIKGLTKKLIWDNNKKYMLATLLVKDCIVEQNTAVELLIYMQGGLIKDLELTNSTFYNKQINNKYFIQYNGSNRITTNAEWASKYNWLQAGVSITNCTFWQVIKTGQMANYSGIAQKKNYLIVTRNIFVDSGNKAVIRRLSGGNTNMDSPRLFDYNSYWFDGVFATDEISANYDNSNTYISTDPQLADPQNGDFTVRGTNQIANRTGDPRWLPAQ